MDISSLSVTAGDEKRRKRYTLLYSTIVVGSKRARKDKRKQISFLKIPSKQVPRLFDEPEDSLHPTAANSLETIEEISNQKDEHSEAQNALLEIVRITKAIQGGDSVGTINKVAETKDDSAGWLANYYRYSDLGTAQHASSRAASSVRSRGSSRPPYDIKVMLQPSTLNELNFLAKKVSKGIPCCGQTVPNEEPKTEREPKWSIRRSACVACSQKWKDLTAIANIKNSGLRRRAILERMPSCLAPARLKNSIKTEYRPKPMPADDTHRCSSSMCGLQGVGWQLARARRTIASHIARNEKQKRAASSLLFSQQSLKPESSTSQKKFGISKISGLDMESGIVASTEAPSIAA